MEGRNYAMGFGECFRAIVQLDNDYAYDDLSRLDHVIQSGSGIATKRADFDYDLNGRVTFLQRSTNTAGTTLAADSSYDYDELDRLTQLVHRQGAGSTNYFQIAAYAMGYDAANRIVRIDSSVDEASLYSYDRAGQLTAAEHTFETDEAYSYDANGNRTNAGYTTTTNNRLSTDGVFTYTYDDEGNRTSRTEIATGRKDVYSWDHRNRLSEVWFQRDATTIVRKIRYAYDPFDRRVGREDDDTSSFTFTDAEKTWFLYDGADVALDYHDDDVSGGAAAALATRYLHGPAVDELLAQEDVGASDPVRWLLPDHLGSTRDLVESDGDVAAHYQYDSFGQLVDGLEDATRYLYTGREWDSATDYNYHRARWLDPATGKWLSEDPIGFAAGDANLTRYVGNGAAGATDADGLRVVKGKRIVRNVIRGEGSIRDGTAHEITINAKYRFRYAPKNWNGGDEYILNKDFIDMNTRPSKVYRVAQFTADEATFIGTAGGVPAAERAAAAALEAIQKTWVFTNIPVLSWFFPENFGSHCARWGTEYVNQLGATDGFYETTSEGVVRHTPMRTAINYNTYGLRAPVPGGPEHFVVLVQILGGKIMGIDNGWLGLDDHIFDPLKVIKDTSKPIELRCDLEDALKAFPAPLSTQ